MIGGSYWMLVPRPILVFALVFAVFVYGDEARAQSCAGFSKRVTERIAGEHKGTQDLLVIGDFDGNGEPDRAFFVNWPAIKPLVICLHGQRRTHKVTDVSSVANLGIRPAGPGVYDHACVKGIGPDCRPGQKVRLELNGPAFELFTYGGSSRIFHWTNYRFESFWVR